MCGACTFRGSACNHHLHVEDARVERERRNDKGDPHGVELGRRVHVGLHEQN